MADASPRALTTTAERARDEEEEDEPPWPIVLAGARDGSHDGRVGHSMTTSCILVVLAKKEISLWFCSERKKILCLLVVAVALSHTTCTRERTRVRARASVDG